MKVANFQLDELLQQANDAENPAEILKSLVNESKFIRKYLEMYVSDEWCKFDPDKVKWNPSTYHRSMAGALLINAPTLRIVTDVLFAERVTLHTKSHHYKSIMEMLCIGEAKILEAILKKNLPDLYPNLTFEVINSVL